jgi:tetratricopeptide (TPR) repeat protein
MGQSVNAFGGALRFHRKRARITQDELGRAVGYSREHIAHLESGRRLPDVTTIAALFVPALDLADDAAARLIALATTARNEPAPNRISHTRTVTTITTVSVEADAAVDAGAIAHHRQAAQWAEMAEGDMLKAASEYTLAGDVKQAADVLTERGVMLAGQGRSEEAATVIDAVLARIAAAPGGHDGHTDIVCRLLTTRGDALLNTARADEAERDYRRASDLAVGAVRANLIHRLCACLAQRGKAAEAAAMAEQALNELPPHLTLIRAQLRVVEAGALMNLARLAEAEVSARAAIEAATTLATSTPLASASIRARANNQLGALHAIRQELTAAVGHWRATIETARLAGLRMLEYYAQGNIANASFEAGDLPAAQAACDAAIEGLRAIDDQVGLSRFVHLNAVLAFVREDLPAAIAHAEEAIVIKTRTGDIASLALSRAQLGRTLLVQGRFSAAREALNNALVEADGVGNQRVRRFVVIALAELDIAEGRAGEASQALQRELTSPVAREDGKLNADLSRVLVLEHAAAGDWGAARAAHHPEPNAGVEIGFENALVSAVLAMPDAKERAAHRTQLNALAEDATQRGYHLHARRARNLASILDAADIGAAVRAVLC